MIVDSSAIVAIVCNERDGSNFLSKLANSVEPLRISAASYLECAIVIDRLKDPILNSRLDELLEQLGVVIEPVTVQQAIFARQAHRDFGKGSGNPAQLNFGDCLAYALAREFSEAILFKGNDFSQTDLRSALA